MKMFLGLLLATLSTTLFAEVTPEHVESMLQQMVKENVISRAEADKAKIRLRTMNTQQWHEINKQAKKIAASSSRAPASAGNQIEEVRGLDLDSAQFKQIESDMKKIVPVYNH